MKKKISIIIPAYNEEGNISLLAKRLTTVSNELSEKYFFEVVFVNDGSTDGTEKVLIQTASAGEIFKYISFSRNFGHQSAIKAGLDHASGDCAITMDADLQHPPELIPEMISKWEDGWEIVYTSRVDNLNNGWFKVITSKLFYALISTISDIKIEKGAADFRLVDRIVINTLTNLDETDFFWRGLIAWVGFKQFKLEYEPQKRYAGQSKYTIKKMAQFAIKGITSFSIKPLRLSLYLGFLVSTLSFSYATYAIFIYFFNNQVVSGWTSLLICTLLIGGIQLIILGIIGEYLGKLFIQSKKRPHYIIRKSNI